VRDFVGYLLTVYIIILFCRVVLSWFPLQPGTVLAQINRVLFDITEPVLRPFRRIIPPVGMFDLSFVVVIILLYVIRDAIVAG
jgi:YggT family protein